MQSCRLNGPRGEVMQCASTSVAATPGSASVASDHLPPKIVRTCATVGAPNPSGDSALHFP